VVEDQEVKKALIATHKEFGLDVATAGLGPGKEPRMQEYLCLIHSSLAYTASNKRD